MADEEQVADEQVIPDETDVTTDVASAPAPEESAPVEEPEATTETTEEWEGIRSAATAAGYDLSGQDSDEAALQHLVEQAQQVDQLRQQAQQAQQWQQMAQQLYQQNQQKTEPEAAPADPKFWNAPEYSDNWLQQVQTDENGQLIPGPNGSMETVAKLNQYLQYQQDQRAQFWQDPFSYMQPFVEHIAKQAVTNGSTELQSQIESNFQVNQFMDKNSDWLYSAPNVLSDEGKVFNEAISQLSSAGMPLEQQINWGMQSVQSHRDRTKLAQLEAGGSSEEKKKGFLKKEANFSPDSAGTERQTTQKDGATPPQNPNESLAERLTRELHAAGVTDEDIAQNY